ncbi:MAG TPA: DUF222 domain-containing protein [Pseudonocardiaceae bacterium]|jgi:hypothetical protein
MFDTDQAPAPGLLPGVPWSEFEPSGLLTDLLSSLDVEMLSADDALETAAAWERLVAHAQAQQLRALARFADTRVATDLEEFATAEVAPVLHLSRRAADARLDLATRLTTRLPDTLGALQSGALDLPRARAISEATEALDESATTAVQARVLPKAPKQTIGELRAALSRAVLAADPDAAERRHRAARNDRRVQLHPHPDGMAALWALLPADHATAAYARLDMLARDLPANDPRSMDARRADALTDLLLGRDVHGEHQTTVEVQVNLDAATLAGLAENPGELAGYGPIPADMARELAAAARRWRAALVDEQTGQLKDLSVAYRPSAYRPSRLLNLVVQARDRTCCFPGCRRPARRCDLDHTIPYGQGGPTVGGNLGPLCRYHHRLKTHTSWALCQPEPGLFLWTSPTGRVHHFRAPPRTEYHLGIRPHPGPPPF